MNNLPFNSLWNGRRGIAGALILLLGLIGWLFISLPARADVAPPDFPPGTNPEPGSEVTQVRMLSETVVLDILPGPAWRGYSSCYDRAADPKTRPARAQVTANFQMRNLGSAAERMTVRFPLSFWNDQTEYSNHYPEISEVKVEVNGQPVATTNTSVRDSITPWANFDVIFPPGQDVPIKVSYIADGACADVFIAFGYVLETGAGWKDTIGQADIIVRLPYDASVMNIAPFTGFSRTSPGATLNAREVRWHFENLEPTTEHNLEVSLIWPSLWQALLTRQQAVQQQSDDGEAWGQLGKAYKELLYYHHDMRTDEGGQELYRRSVEAYAKAVTLLPNDGLWHAGFADLLINHYYYSYPDQDMAEMNRGVEELNRSLALAPNNEKAQELIGWLGAVFTNEVQRGPDGYYFLTPTPQPTLTSTSTAEPLPTATSTSGPTATLIPPGTLAPTRAVATVSTETPVASPTNVALAPTSAPTGAPKSTPLCGTAVALPAMMVLGVVWSRGRRAVKRD
ncbi:hypothetical protein TFLX_03412 [Thermoflexales bacterium]|nr:hypothetical protein TFLX_03412 [Thermoflexales bacterium]